MALEEAPADRPHRLGPVGEGGGGQQGIPRSPPREQIAGEIVVAISFSLSQDSFPKITNIQAQTGIVFNHSHSHQQEQGNC